MNPTRPLAWTLGLLALCACGGPSRIAEVQEQELLDAALADPRLDRAPRVRADWLRVDPELYGYDATRPGGPSNDVSFDADVCESGDRHFLFVTRQHAVLHCTLVWVEIGEGEPAATIDERIEAMPAQQKLPFDVEAVPGGLVLLHADGHRVVERRATVAADGLAFAPPRTLVTADARILAVQVTRTDDRLHALWTTADERGECTVFHCSAAPADVAWTEPSTLSRHAANAARMAAGDRDLYVAWRDNRYRWRKHAFAGYRNDGKVCVIASRDGGRSFTSPVVLNDPENFADLAEAVDLVVGRGGLAVYWRKPGQLPTMGRVWWWGLAALDFDLQRMHRGRDVGGGAHSCR